MRLTLIAAFALLCSFAAQAVGPQDVTLTFQTRAGGGPVEGRRLYINGALVGEVTSGRAAGLRRFLKTRETSPIA
jgi:hypothetical protein